MEAYKIGIVLRLTNNASSVLGLVQRDFAKTEAAAKTLQTAMDRIHRSVILGGASGAILFGLDKALKPAMEYQHQLELMKTAGMQQKEIAEATGAAWRTTRDVITTTAADNLKTIRELRQVFGDTGDAVSYLPAMQRLNAVLSATLGDKADAAFDAAKVQELRGSTRNPAEFDKQAGMMAQAVAMSGGRVLPKDFLQFARQAAPFTTNFSDRFLYNIVPTMMQDMGGSRAGTALNTLAQAVISGHMTKAAFLMFQKTGLLGAHAHYRPGSAGTLQLMKDNKVAGASLFQSDPFEWTQRVLLPAIQRSTGNDPKAQQYMLGMLFSNRNGQRVENDFIVNFMRYMKDAALVNTAAKPWDAYNELSKRDPNTLRQALAVQWNNLLTRLTNVVLPALLPLMTRLVSGLEKLADVAARHPAIAKFAVETVAVTGAILGLAAAFGVMMAALGPLRLLLLGSGGLGAAGTTGLAGLAVGGALKAAIPAAAGYGAGTLFGDWFARKDPEGFGRFKSWMDGWLPKGMQTGGSTGAVPPAQQSAAQQRSDVYLDKKKVGSVM